MERVEDWSDGYAEAWFLPAATNIPAGFATEGTWFDFFRGKAAAAWAPPGARARRRFSTPTRQRPSTAWYHDHTLGMTRLNVYAGPAGFYIIRSTTPPTTRRSPAAAAPAVLPGPAPSSATSPSERVLRDPDRDPGPLVQYGRLAVLSRHAGVLRWLRRTLHPRQRRVADLEPRVLRQLHRRERQDLAVPGRRAAPLPLPAAERVPVALPDPELR